MKSKVTIFPIGNADTTLIQLVDSGKNILWDYANMQGEKHCDLPAELNKRIDNRDFYDVVCFTHGDKDHVRLMSEYFYLRHAEKYQGPGRKKIVDLWVPAAILLESRNDLCDDAVILKAEAKYRLLTDKKGIKVFSKPDALKAWVEANGVKFEEISHLVVDAGTCVPGWSKEKEGVEIFVHSPFKGHVDEQNVIDRNCSAIVVQMLFANMENTRLLLGSDISSEEWRDIVWVTKFHKVNIDRLIWNILHTSHHCSYKSINKDDKGERKTPPIDETKWLYEVQSSESCMVIIPSDIIPDTYDNGNGEPVHRQAYNYYNEDVVIKKKGTIKVTMETPNKVNPAPIEIEITDVKAYLKGNIESLKKAATVLVSQSAVSGNWCE